MFALRSLLRSPALRRAPPLLFTPQLHLVRRAISSVSTGRTPFLLADIGEGIAEVEVIQFFVEEGDKVSQFQPLVEVQSDKATVEISSRYDGIVDALSYKPGDIATVGSPLCYIRTSEAGVAPDADAQKESKEETVQQAEPPKRSHIKDHSQSSDATTKSDGIALATPSTRRLAREHGLDIDVITGSGGDGRVLDEDVLNHVHDPPTRSASEVPEHESTRQAEPAKGRAENTVEPIRGLRRGMLKSMAASLEIPHFGLADDVSMEGAMALRRHIVTQLGADAKLRFTLMPIFIKATSMALSEFPVLNARLDMENSSIVYQSSHNISIAMNTKEGLIVPNIKAVERLSMLEIAEELMRLGELRDSGKFGGGDLEDGTFTLSNIGSIGGRIANPVVFAPQSCIGALGAVRKRAVVDDSSAEVVVRDMVTVSWAADHRIVDGATMAMFNRRWKEFVERPEGMLAHMK